MWKRRHGKRYKFLKSSYDKYFIDLFCDKVWGLLIILGIFFVLGSDYLMGYYH
jgi:hypothetical protein